jgi:hypothetical protein
MKNTIHWNIFMKQFTSHTYKGCANPDSILVVGKWSTEVKPERKDNPRGWVRCDHIQVTHNPSQEAMEQYVKTQKLIYDKTLMEFNITEGNGLFCDKDGCWLLDKITDKGEGKYQ